MGRDIIVAWTGHNDAKSTAASYIMASSRDVLDRDSSGIRVRAIVGSCIAATVEKASGCRRSERSLSVRANRSSAQQRDARHRDDGKERDMVRCVG